MKALHFISILCLFIFLLGCKAKMDVEMEKSNPLEGTSWERISGEFTRGNDKIIESGNHPRVISIFGKTYCSFVGQDTSRKTSNFGVGKYIIKGDSIIFAMEMFPHYEDIGREFAYNFQIEGDKMVVTAEDIHFYGHDWKTYREEWKKID